MDFITELLDTAREIAKEGMALATRQGETAFWVASQYSWDVARKFDGTDGLDLDDDRIKFIPLA